MAKTSDDQRMIKGQKTAQTLLRIARKSFEKNGYAGTRTQDIIAQAGITKGALYHHYSSKQALFEAVYRDAEEDVATRIQAASAGAASPMAQLIEGCFAYLEICADQGLRQIMRVDGPAVLGVQKWSEIDREYGVERLIPFLQMLQDQGVIDVQEVEAFTWQLTGAMNEATFWIARHPDPELALEQSKSALNRILDSIRAV